jgi:valyl-tRNA synthetase
MKLLHPFMPFVTEEIYRHLVNDDPSIMISSWPVYSSNLDFPTDERNMELIMDAIRNIRNIRAEMNVPPARKAKVIFVAGDQEGKVLVQGKAFFERLAGASEIVVQPDKVNVPSDAVASIIAGAEIYIPLEDLIDIEKEVERLEKELDNLQKELDRVNGKLSNQGFVSKAPAKVIEEEKAKQAKYKEMYGKVMDRLHSLKK